MTLKKTLKLRKGGDSIFGNISKILNTSSRTQNNIIKMNKNSDDIKELMTVIKKNLDIYYINELNIK